MADWEDFPSEDAEITCPSCQECSLFTLFFGSVGIHARCQNCQHELAGESSALGRREASEPNPIPAGTEAEAALKAVVAYCRKVTDQFNATMPFSVRPEDMRVSAGDILAIIKRKG